MFLSPFLIDSYTAVLELICTFWGSFSLVFLSELMMYVVTTTGSIAARVFFFKKKRAIVSERYGIYGLPIISSSILFLSNGIPPYAAVGPLKPSRTEATEPYLASTSSCTFSMDLKYLTVLTRSSSVASSLS